MTRGLLVRAAAWLRIVELVPWPLAFLLTSHTRMAYPLVVGGSVLAHTGWSLFFAGRALRRGTISNRIMLVDVAVAACCLMISGRGTAIELSASWSNPAVAPALGTVVAAAVVWRRSRALLAGAILALSYLIGAAGAIRSPGPTLTAVIGNVFSLLGLPLLAGAISAALMRHAWTVHTTTAVMLAERDRVAAERVRRSERGHQYRILHDTVLSTLNAVARGAGNATNGLRQRCAADAALIRNMISGDLADVSLLAVELALVVHEQSALGLRVHSQIAELREDLSRHVVSCLSGAAREALNNVAKHAGTGEAWLTAVTDPDGSVVVTVLDRGSGFAPSHAPSGRGLTRSIVDPVRESGGIAVVESIAGQGTSVELRWPT